MSRCFVVLGMGRSGTSMVSEILHTSGITMVQKKQLSHPFNVRGHYEDLGFVNLNMKMLKALSKSWKNPPNNINLKKLEPFEEDAKKLISMRNIDNWGWKDPRTILLWNFWKTKTPENTVIIKCHRDKKDIADSLYRQYSMPQEDSLKFIEVYLDKLQNIDGIDIEYCQMFTSEYREVIKKMFMDQFDITLNFDAVDVNLNHARK